MQMIQEMWGGTKTAWEYLDGEKENHNWENERKDVKKRSKNLKKGSKVEQVLISRC